MSILNKVNNWSQKKKQYICMNPICFKNELLIRYECKDERPIIHLAKTCWNCHTSEHLVEIK